MHVSVPEWTLTVEQDTSTSVATVCSPILVSIHQVLEEIHSSNNLPSYSSDAEISDLPQGNAHTQLLKIDGHIYSKYQIYILLNASTAPSPTPKALLFPNIKYLAVH